MNESNSNEQSNPIPFHQWKAERVKRDGGVIRPRDWYYAAYGRYCLTFRRGRA